MPLRKQRGLTRLKKKSIWAERCDGPSIRIDSTVVIFDSNSVRQSEHTAWLMQSATAGHAPYDGVVEVVLVTLVLVWASVTTHDHRRQIVATAIGLSHGATSSAAIRAGCIPRPNPLRCTSRMPAPTPAQWTPARDTSQSVKINVALSWTCLQWLGEQCAMLMQSLWILGAGPSLARLFACTLGGYEDLFEVFGNG